MKKLLFLLLLIPFLLQAQPGAVNTPIGYASPNQITIVGACCPVLGANAQEQIIEKYPKSSTNPYGYVILKPSDYSPTKSYSVWPFVHGAGGREDGSSSALSAQVTVSKVQVKLSNGKFIPAIWYASAYAPAKAPAFIFICGRGEQLKGGATQQNLDNTYNILLASGNHADLVKNSGKYGINILAPVIADEYNDWKPDIQGAKYIRDVTRWAIDNLNIDPARIIPIGLSSGGNAVFDAVVRDSNTAKLYAGAVPICSGELNNSQGALHWDYPAKYGIAVWAFHSKDDGPTTPPVMSINQIALINSYNPVPAAKLTLYPTGGHSGAWRNAFADTALYKWALTLKKNSVPAQPEPPQPPAKTIIARLETILYSDGSFETKKLQ